MSVFLLQLAPIIGSTPHQTLDSALSHRIKFTFNNIEHFFPSVEFSVYTQHEPHEAVTSHRACTSTVASYSKRNGPKQTPQTSPRARTCVAEFLGQRVELRLDDVGVARHERREAALQRRLAPRRARRRRPAERLRQVLADHCAELRHFCDEQNNRELRHSAAQNTAQRMFVSGVAVVGEQ